MWGDISDGMGEKTATTGVSHYVSCIVQTIACLDVIFDLNDECVRAFCEEELHVATNNPF